VTILVLNQIYTQVIEAVEYARQEYGANTARKLAASIFKLIQMAATLPGARIADLPPQHYRLALKRYPYILLCRRNEAKGLVVVYLLWYSGRPLPSTEELEALANEAERTGHPYQPEELGEGRRSIR